MQNNVNCYCGSSVPKMVSQQASSWFLQTTTEGKFLTKSGNLFHCSTIRTEKAAFRRARWKERWCNFRSWPRRWEQDGELKNLSCCHKRWQKGEARERHSWFFTSFRKSSARFLLYASKKSAANRLRLASTSREVGMWLLKIVCCVWDSPKFQPPNPKTEKWELHLLQKWLSWRCYR